ncbi:MAG: gamma-glutamylcyclotransferase [Burkholderiaceae bacterium]
MSDPFASFSKLRGRIVDPEQSRFRCLDYDAMDDAMRRAGLGDDWRRSHEAREATRVAALARHGPGDLWVFAYGSLMWDPAIRFVEARPASVTGFHRRFCIQSLMGRGSPEQPGLMAGLDAGGHCQGIAYRIAAAQVEHETRVLWSREMITPTYLPTYAQTHTPGGLVSAITFVVDRSQEKYRAALDDEQTARMIARGEGVFGRNIDYLNDLVRQMRALGIVDEPLFALHALANRLR